MILPFQKPGAHLVSTTNTASLSKTLEHKETDSLSPIRAQNALPATILLVDDEEDLRYIMELILSMNGYCVIVCGTADLAAIAFRESPSIGLLLTDMQMPGRSGIELARELSASRPSLPVLIMSGGMPTLGARNEINDRRWKFLSKTVDERTLLSTIAGLLR